MLAQLPFLHLCATYIHPENSKYSMVTYYATGLFSLRPLENHRQIGLRLLVNGARHGIQGISGIRLFPFKQVDKDKAVIQALLRPDARDHSCPFVWPP